MPFKIQRTPRGLNSLLSIAGGETPIHLEDHIQGSIELMQVYGAPHRQLFQGTNATLTEGTPIGIGPPFVINAPYLLYGASLTATQTATLTALSMSIWLGVPPAGYTVYSKEFQNFGATVTGQAKASWYAPYPILLMPNISCFATCDIIGTDANVANAVFSMDIALLN